MEREWKWKQMKIGYYEEQIQRKFGKHDNKILGIKVKR